jgi:hypothetical protein
VRVRVRWRHCVPVVSSKASQLRPSKASAETMGKARNVITWLGLGLGLGFRVRVRVRVGVRVRVRVQG